MDEQHSRRLLYFCSKFWDLCGNINLHMTTFIERGHREYFAGFCSLRWFAPMRRRSRRLNWDELEQEFDEDEDGSELELDYFEGNGQYLYRWIHMSLIFRASYCGNRMSN